MTLRFRLLGPLEVGVRPRSTSLTGPQQRALLALLMINRGRVVAPQELIAEAWPAADREIRVNTLHAQMVRLRQSLRPLFPGEMPLETYPGGYILNVDGDDVDGEMFARLRRRARTQEPSAAIATLRHALGLWRGEALQDAAIGRKVQAAAASLEEARLQAHEHLAELTVEHGDPTSVVDDLSGLVVLHPMRETLLAVQMSALAACGRNAEALVVYREARGRFTAELGIEPGETMRRQHLRILQGACR